MLTGGFGPRLFHRKTIDNITVNLEVILEFQVCVLVILSVGEDMEGMPVKVTE